ncbi:MAG: hypothetical protein ABIN95_11205 [Mucilaginibacter sp.]
MTNTVFVSKVFQREVKPLAKKYHTLKDSVNTLIEKLKHDPFIGTPYGSDIYKIRLADESKGSGKRGGLRVMYYHLNKTEQGIDILLMSIYNKADKATIKKQEALQILSNILKEHNNPGI